MNTVLAYPGNMAHAQHAARAMWDVGCLTAYVTTYAFRPQGRLASLLARVPSPAGERLLRQLVRRSIDQVPMALVHTYPMWEILRSGAQKAGASPALVDMLWDELSYRFDALVARRYVAHVEAIQSFEYTALATFKRAQQVGAAKILHLPSIDSSQFIEIERREKQEWKELGSAYDAYFERKFPRRQERRRNEIDLADIIIANSSLTARSHIAAGANSEKILVVKLGAPPAIEKITSNPRREHEPLRVISAGPFSLRKGAHYLLKAWRSLNAGRAAILDVYGRMGLPDHALAAETANIAFHGSVAQPTLFDAIGQPMCWLFPLWPTVSGALFWKRFLVACRSLPPILQVLANLLNTAETVSLCRRRIREP